MTAVVEYKFPYIRMSHKNVNSSQVVRSRTFKAKNRKDGRFALLIISRACIVALVSFYQLSDDTQLKMKTGKARCPILHIT